MRYHLELEIIAPRERVIELFLDPDNLLKWQPDLVSFEPIGEGEPRQVGAKTRQVHKMGKREVETIETITAHNHPDEFSATYEADKVWHLIENRFVDIDDGKTRWILDSECNASGFVGIMIRLFPGMLKKQTSTFMNHFKEFAEASNE